MKRHALVLGMAFVAFGAGGCVCLPPGLWCSPCLHKHHRCECKSQERDGPRTQWFTVTGFSGDGSTVEVPPPFGTKPLPFSIGANRLIKTDGFVKIHIVDDTIGQPKKDFTAVLAPNPGSQEPAVAWIVTNLQIKATEGNLFLWGQWPSGGTPWVRPAPPGTTYAVQVDQDASGAEVHRVYYVKATEVGELTAECGEKSMPPLKEGEYFEVRTGCDPTGPLDIEGDAERKKFIITIGCIAKAAGCPEGDLPKYVNDECP